MQKKGEAEAPPHYKMKTNQAITLRLSLQR